MIKDVAVECAGNESGATGAFLAELRRGPFAPALVASILDQYGVTMKLSDFISRYLSDKVVAIYNQNMSPVGRPALCLRSEMRNPEYWRGDAGFVGYRLSSLAAGAWDGVRNLDMSVLDVSPQKGEASYTSHVPVSDFERSFIIGKMITGRIDRRAHGALGWLVACEVDGKAYRCFVPDTEIDQTIATPGFVGQFEVISTLPQKRSVLLRFVKSEAVVRQKAELETRESLSIDPVLLKIKERLSRLKQLHLDGELDDEEYTSRRQRIIDAI